MILGFSLANLCLISAWFASLFDADHGYFNKVPVSSTTLLALLTNLVALTLFFWAVATVVVRHPKGQLVADLALIIVWAIPLNCLRMIVLNIPDRRLLTFFTGATGVVILIALVWVVALWHRRIARSLAFVLLLISPLALITVGRVFLLLLGWQKIDQDTAIVHATAPLRASSNLPRVVWIIFDELDYRVAFGERPKSLQIPELDRFAKESLSATRAYPPAGATIASVPALLSGVNVLSARPRSSSDLWLEMATGQTGSATSPEKISWNQLRSVFSDARDLGANCGIVGWYHPYGRLFSDSVGFSKWFPIPTFEPARAPTFAGTLERELCSMMGPINQRYLQVQIYKESLAAGAELSASTPYQLVFLHLPVPHKPGIAGLDGKLTYWGVRGLSAYLGNVQLASRAFGAIRQRMESTGTWQPSWVIVSADHWWREATGNPGPIDNRIPFIVKAPDARGERYDKPFSTVLTRSLVIGILKKEVKSADQLREWLDQHNSPPPAFYKTHVEPE